MMPVSMVGRTDELAELVRAWSVVAASAPAEAPTEAPTAPATAAAADRGTTARTAVITGEAGVGKSMLVAAALARMAPRPAAVLSGTARVHAPAPYDWLAAVLSGRDTGQLPIAADALAWLAQHPDAHAERYAPGALLRMAVRTVRALVDAGPAVLIVEDLHALDPASLNLVGELAAAPDLPALLLVTSQPPDAAVSPQLAARTLARLSGAQGAIRQHLGPLAPADIGAILAEVYPDLPVRPEAVLAVRDKTGGNPYWIRELLVAGGAAQPPGADLPDEAATDLPDLTARETEVLSCLAAGMSNKQVARSLGISIRTVAVHVSSLLRKTRTASRTEAALWAVKHRMARPTVPS
jgi:DNA-binding CsgD family transcriptional regulator